MKLMNASIISLAIYVAPFYAMNDKEEKEKFNMLDMVRYAQYHYSQDRKFVEELYKREDELVKDIEKNKVSTSIEKNKIDIETNSKSNGQELKDIILEWQRKYLNQESDDENCLVHTAENVITSRQTEGEGDK